MPVAGLAALAKTWYEGEGKGEEKCTSHTSTAKTPAALSATRAGRAMPLPLLPEIKHRRVKARSMTPDIWHSLVSDIANTVAAYHCGLPW
jgi:hypothetical protein